MTRKNYRSGFGQIVMEVCTRYTSNSGQRYIFYHHGGQCLEGVDPPDGI